MSSHPTPGGGPNQTLLELIYSLKGLAQTVEFFHQDLVLKIEEDGKIRSAEFKRLHDQLSRSNQNIAVLPITLSDRMEKLLGRLESQVGEKLEEVEDAVENVRKKLWEYTKTAERAISQHDGTVEERSDEVSSDVTGRIEVTKKGDVNLMLKSTAIKRIWYGVVLIATGGGAYGFVELLKKIFGSLG